MKLRDYQRDAVYKVFDFFSKRKSGKLLLASPTGTGKSFIQLSIIEKIREQKPDAEIHVITSKINIIRGYLKMLLYAVATMSIAAMRRKAATHKIFTYTSYRNKLIKGQIESPDVLLIDEAHHFKLGNILTDQILWDASTMKIVGFTATPYRATPKATYEFRREWDEIYIVITEREALLRGVWRFPDMHTVGLMNDDLLTMRNGEFVIRTMKDVYKCAGETFSETIYNLIKHVQKEMLEVCGRLLPIIIDTPGTDVCIELTEYLNAKGVPCNTITHKTKDKERAKCLNELEAGTHVLTQVNIITEGFDLPDLCVAIDAKPKASPVAFMQFFGRLTRPSDIPFKRYYCLCRNIERHAYLFDGIIPAYVVTEAQQAFQQVSQRNSQRVFGSEKIGRLKALPFVLKDGTTASFYLVNSTDHTHGKKTSYAILLLPHKKDPIVCQREDIKQNIDPEKPWKFGKWRKSELPEDFTGYGTAPNRRKTLTEKQDKFWKSAAGRYGLDDSIQVDGRQFQILPILKDSGVKVLEV